MLAKQVDEDISPMACNTSTEANLPSWLLCFLQKNLHIHRR